MLKSAPTEKAPSAKRLHHSSDGSSGSDSPTDDHQNKRTKVLEEGGVDTKKFTVRALKEPTRTNDDIHSSISLCSVTLALQDTSVFQRLRRLKQLGVAELVYQNCNHTRFEHSVGVAHLAYRMMTSIQHRQPQLGITTKDILCVKLAGLLHDVGHGPYSHAYEEFVNDRLPEYLKEHPELNDCYEHPCRQDKMPRPKWTHEQMSLTLVDEALKELGLQIDLHHLDEPLKQVGNGIDAKYFTVDGEQDGDVLTSRDFVFIKECISGAPLRGTIEEKILGGVFCGREDNKQWMYDIVCNGHGGLDVDKIDYYARDERRANREAGEIDKVMIEEATVARAVCSNPKCKHRVKEGRHLMICYPEKLIGSTISFFQKRFKLHDTIYKHKTVSAASYMITDILCLADPYFRLTVDSNDNSHGLDEIPVSFAMHDPSVYLELVDSVIDQIRSSRNPELEKARLLVKRYKKRDLYKCVKFRKFINMQDEREVKLWHMSENEIKEGMVNLGGEHDGGENLLKLKLDDFIVEKCSIHHGSKDKNPLDYMRFLPKSREAGRRNPPDELPVAEPFREIEYRAHLPQDFQQNKIRVYSRDSSKEKRELLAHIFVQWCENELLKGLGDVNHLEMTAGGTGNGEEPEEYAQFNMLSQETADGGSDDDDDDDEDYGANNGSHSNNKNRASYILSSAPHAKATCQITPPQQRGRYLH